MINKYVSLDNLQEYTDLMKEQINTKIDTAQTESVSESKSYTDTQVNEVSTIAANAETKAAEAETKAEDATTVAQAADTKADGAQTAADSAMSRANEAYNWAGETSAAAYSQAKTEANQYTDTKVAQLGAVQVLKGRVASVEDLPKNPSVGDTYIVGSAEDNCPEYVYTEEGWEELGKNIDLSGYYSKAELDPMLAQGFSSMGQQIQGVATSTNQAIQSLSSTMGQQFTDVYTNIGDVRGIANEGKGKAEQALNNKQDKLIPGDNITISEDNVISAAGGGQVDIPSYTVINETVYAENLDTRGAYLVGPNGKIIIRGNDLDEETYDHVVLCTLNPGDWMLFYYYKKTIHASSLFTGEIDIPDYHNVIVAFRHKIGALTRLISAQVTIQLDTAITYGTQFYETANMITTDTIKDYGEINKIEASGRIVIYQAFKNYVNYTKNDVIINAAINDAAAVDLTIPSGSLILGSYTDILTQNKKEL